MSDQPTLETARLLLRPFNDADAPAVQEMAGHRDVARFTLNVPHPYLPGMAAQWIAGHARAWSERNGMTCAIERREDGNLVGAIGLRIDGQNERAELGYWIGHVYWGNGYATEAGRELVRFAFDTLGLNRVMARHFTSNEASGRVMQKIGMRREGLLRQHYLKWGEFEDVVIYGILATDCTT